MNRDSIEFNTGLIPVALLGTWIVSCVAIVLMTKPHEIPSDALRDAIGFTGLGTLTLLAASIPVGLIILIAENGFPRITIPLRRCKSRTRLPKAETL